MSTLQLHQAIVFIFTLQESSLAQLHCHLIEQKTEGELNLCELCGSSCFFIWHPLCCIALSPSECHAALRVGGLERGCGTCFPTDFLVPLPLKFIFSGGDFTNIFYLLSSFSVDTDPSRLEDFLEKLISQCASVEELRVAFKPQMDPRYCCCFL